MIDPGEDRVCSRQPAGGELSRLAVEKLGVVGLHQWPPHASKDLVGGGPAGGAGRFSKAGTGAVDAPHRPGGRPGVPLRASLQEHVEKHRPYRRLVARGDLNSVLARSPRASGPRESMPRRQRRESATRREA